MSAFPWHREALAAILSERERMPHALLVQGPSGIGKVEFARALAQGLLCESPRAGLACEACSACHWFSQSNHPDYREIVPEASEESDDEALEDSARADAKKSLVIKVDQIRAVADFISLTTHRAGFRVLLVRPAEAMQAAAANALLKTLEEPPPATVIALVADARRAEHERLFDLGDLHDLRAVPGRIAGRREQEGERCGKSKKRDLRDAGTRASAIGGFRFHPGLLSIKKMWPVSPCPLGEAHWRYET